MYNKSFAQYPEGSGIRYIRTQVRPFGYRIDGGEHREGIILDTINLWVSTQFGDGRLNRDSRAMTGDQNVDQTIATHQSDLATRTDVSMWLPIVTRS